MKVCPRAQTECPHCKNTFERSKIKPHIKKMCTAVLLDCDFHLLGCQGQLYRPQMKDHIRNNGVSHAQLLTEYTKEHCNDVTKLKPYLSMLKSSVNNLAELADENKSLRKQRNILATVIAIGVFILLITIYIFSGY